MSPLCRHVIVDFVNQGRLPNDYFPRKNGPRDDDPTAFAGRHGDAEGRSGWQRRLSGWQRRLRLRGL